MAAKAVAGTLRTSLGPKVIKLITVFLFKLPEEKVCV